MKRSDQDSRPAKSGMTHEYNRDVRYSLKVPGHGVLVITIATVDEDTGRVEFRAAIQEDQR